MGADAGGRQSSTVFCGAPIVKGVLEKNFTNVTRIVDELTTAFKWVLVFISIIYLYW
jgi:hypothetical protein